MEEECGGKEKGKAGEGGKADAAQGGERRVAFSPYVVPIFTIWVCALD